MRNTKHKLFYEKSLKYLHNDLDICGIVRNHFIALSMRYFRRYGKGLSYAKMSAHLTKLKRLEKYKHWNIPYSWALQNVLKRLAESFKEMRTLGRGHPQFKSCKKHKGMTFRGEQIKLAYLLPKQKHERNHPTYEIRLNGRWYRFALHRNIEGKIIQVQVTRDALGDVYITLTEECSEIKHQSRKRLKSVHKIGRWTASTKSCSVCEHKNDSIPLSDRQWICPKCHTHLDRDHNAAINILKEGVASFGLGDVRPIVLLGRIVGCSVEVSTSRLLKSTNAFA